MDTAAKRMQMLGFGSGDTLPIPDGALAVADRLHFLWLYGGITPAVAIDPGATCLTAASITAAGVSAAITAAGVGATIAASATGQTITCD